MKIKTIMRYYFTTTRIAIIKHWKITSVGEDVEQLEFLDTEGIEKSFVSLKD